MQKPGQDMLALGLCRKLPLLLAKWCWPSNYAESQTIGAGKVLALEFLAKWRCCWPSGGNYGESQTIGAGQVELALSLCRNLSKRHWSCDYAETCPSGVVARQVPLLPAKWW